MAELYREIEGDALNELSEDLIESPYYESGDVLTRKGHIYWIKAVGGLLLKPYGVCDVMYEGTELFFEQKIGLFRKQWKEFDGNVEKRGYTQIGKLTAINKIKAWLIEDGFLNITKEHKYLN